MSAAAVDGNMTTRRRDSRTSTSGEATAGPSASPAGAGASLVPLICLACTARTFPEFSVDPAAEVAFRYGDDGLSTAMEVTLEVTGIRADLLPMEKGSSSDGGVDGDGSDHSPGVVDSEGELFVRTVVSKEPVQLMTDLEVCPMTYFLVVPPAPSSSVKRTRLSNDRSRGVVSNDTSFIGGVKFEQQSFHPALAAGPTDWTHMLKKEKNTPLCVHVRYSRRHRRNVCRGGGSGAVV